MLTCSFGTGQMVGCCSRSQLVCNSIPQQTHIEFDWMIFENMVGVNGPVDTDKRPAVLAQK